MFGIELDVDLHVALDSAVEVDLGRLAEHAPECQFPDFDEGTRKAVELREAVVVEEGHEIILQGAKEKHPEARPRIISDNGPQFIAKDFKEFIGSRE